MDSATILNVDDNEVNRYIRTQTLTQAGYKVIEAGSGEAALLYIDQECPPLVLLDVNLPDIGGMEVCRRIKEQSSNGTIVVVQISAERIAPEDRVAGLELGADGYLVEPVEPELLVATVRAMMRLWAAERALSKNRDRLQESESQLRLALDAADMGHWARDIRTDEITLSPAAARILGLPAGAIRPEQWYGRIDPERREEVKVKIEAALAGGSDYHAEYSIRLPDGALRWISTHGKLVRYADGKPNMLAGVVQDITHRKETEQALRESEAQFRTLANSIPQLCWIANADGRVFWFNDRWYQYTGLTPEQMEGWGWQTAHDPELLPTVLEHWKRSLESGEPFEMVFPLRGADGVFRPFLTRSVPLRHSGGKIVRWFGTNTDITAQVESERLVRENEERFRRLVESNIIGIAVADLDGVKAANDLFLRLAGYTREDLDRGGVDWTHSTPPEHLARDLQGIEKLRQKGWCEPFEKEYVHADGTRVPILIGAAVLKPDPLEWIAFVIDLTERKALERRLVETQKLESLGLLAGGIAHDFNNLLVGVLGNAGLAQDVLPAGNPADSFLGEIVKAAERAAHLTREMLAYAGKGRFVIERLNLCETVRDVTSLIRSSIPGKVAVLFDLDHGIPSVDADPGQMQQLVMNLVLNAAEAISDEAGVVTIRTAVRDIGAGDPGRPEFSDLSPGAYVCLEVRDTGCGMDAETQANIFDPFFTTKFTGRGLGLAAVSGIVRAHKGAIHVASAPGEGSTFLVLLPASVAAPPASAASGSLHTDLQGTGTILVVDDEDIVRLTAKGALERQGYTVVLADCGKAAIDILARRDLNISLVLLDLSMPGMDGHETLRRLRVYRPDTPVILSSGYNEAECLRLFEGESIAGFVQKPYTFARLAEKVKLALARNPS
jgi:PAS domain S-box-containing protein